MELDGGTSFEKLKEAPVLKYYDASKRVKLSVDASSCGIGAVLSQDECPIAYASKAFTDAQKINAQIEKELAVTSSTRICLDNEKTLGRDPTKTSGNAPQDSEIQHHCEIQKRKGTLRG
jgi:hypothetical protein